MDPDRSLPNHLLLQLRSASNAETLARTDPLTGLYNRRALDENLALILATGQYFSLAILDIDHFKPYNDTFGHVAGDEVLQMISRILTENLRAGDVLARFGGEEFVILLPSTDARTALAIAERLRKCVDEAEWPNRQITISGGVTTWQPEYIQSAPDKNQKTRRSFTKEIIHRADQALYRAKNSGRNRVVHTDNLSNAPAYDLKQARKRITKLERQAKELRYEDIDQAIQKAQRAVEMATSQAKSTQSETIVWVQSLQTLSQLYMQKGDYYQALQNLLQAIELAQPESKWPLPGKIMRDIAIAYGYLGEFTLAMQYFFELDTAAQAQKDVVWQARALNGVAFVLMSMENWTQGTHYLQRALALIEDEDNVDVKSAILDNLCNCYTALGNYREALRVGKHSLALAQSTGDRQLEAESLYSLGEALMMAGDHPGALEYFQKCMIVCKAIDLKVEISRCLQGIGNIQRQMGQLDDATTSFHQALEIARQIDNKREQLLIHRHLAETYRAKGQTKLALNHFEQFHITQQIIQSQDTEVRVENLRAVHDLTIAQQEAEIQRIKAIELQGLLDEKEQLIDDLNAFAHTVAHDLKEPLATLVMGIGMLEKSDKQQLSLAGKEILQSSIYTSKRMERIIDELLLMASISHKEIQRQPLTMQTIVEQAEKRLSTIIRENQTIIRKTNTWHHAIGYAPWIEEVWVNYISNAIKYGGTPPTITIGNDILPNKKVRFWIQDNGNGLKEKEMQQLFKPFKRLSEVDAQGHGLGLSIVRRIVEKLNGKAGVESDGVPGQGCKFYFDLPSPYEETQKQAKR